MSNEGKGGSLPARFAGLAPGLAVVRPAASRALAGVFVNLARKHGGITVRALSISGSFELNLLPFVPVRCDFSGLAEVASLQTPHYRNLHSSQDPEMTGCFSECIYRAEWSGFPLVFLSSNDDKDGLSTSHGIMWSDGRAFLNRTYSAMPEREDAGRSAETADPTASMPRASAPLWGALPSPIRAALVRGFRSQDEKPSRKSISTTPRGGIGRGRLQAGLPTFRVRAIFGKVASRHPLTGRCIRGGAGERWGGGVAMAETAMIKVKEVLFDGLKVRLESGEEVWIHRDKIEDYLPGNRLVVPDWYKRRLMEKFHVEERKGGSHD